MQPNAAVAAAAGVVEEQAAKIAAAMEAAAQKAGVAGTSRIFRVNPNKISVDVEELK